MKFIKGLLHFGGVILVAGLVLTIGMLLLGGDVDEALGGSAVTFDKTTRGAQGVEVSLPFGQVVVENGEQFQVQCQNIPREFITTQTTPDGIWTINVGSDGSFSQRMEYLSLAGIPKVTVTVPQSIAAQAVTVRVDAGRADVSGITAKNIYGEVGMGYLSAAKVISMHMDLKCDVGAVLAAGKTSGKNSFVCHVGAVLAYFQGETESSGIDAVNMLGLLKVDDSAKSGFRNQIRLNSGSEDQYVLRNQLGMARLKFISVPDAVKQTDIDTSDTDSLRALYEKYKDDPAYADLLDEYKAYLE
jgi:hypothetical protein